MAHGKSFRPSDFQAPLPMDKLIVKNPTLSDEAVPLDVVFVGAGPAGLCGAIELARLVKADNESGGGLGEIEIGVLEKAESLGGHTLSGAVMNPKVLQDLFPEKPLNELPLRGAVQGDNVFMLTETGKVPLPTPPTMNNHGNQVASLCEVVRWLGQEAENLGVNMFTSFPADSLLMQGGQVVGVRTTAAGLNREGKETDQYMPPTDIAAQITVLTEGTRGPLTQAYLAEQKITSPAPQIFALGVKEVWRTKKVPKNVTHTLGWPLPKSAFGGSWMYPMGEDLVSIGLVVGLDYKEHNLDVHQMLQSLKKHPLFSEYLEGGELVEWGAKTIPEGGLNAFPEKLHGDGLIMAGDCVGMVNVPALKGIHYAMHSGVLAARAAFKALKASDTSGKTLSSYDKSVKDSFIWKDLHKVRNMRHAFKSGFYLGGLKAALMTATGGAFPGGGHDHLSDGDEKKIFSTNPDEKNIGLSKVDAVYQSGNKTRDDIPQHLIVGKDISPELADFYSHMCPAGVYERKGDQLVVNAPNCVDCKATDVLGPRWLPREGGSGPSYTLM